MIIISHFHKDHISGINFLLDKLKSKPRDIFLPYFTEIQRKYILIKNISFALENDWYIQFLKNPSEYLKSKRIENIHYIHSSDEHNGEDNLNNIPLDRSFDRLNIRLERLKNEQSNLEENHYSDKGYVQIGYWFFKFFNLKKDLKNFRECLENKNLGEISNIKLKRDIKSLKDCYKKINGNFNDTSLVVLHKPLINRGYMIAYYHLYPYCQLRTVQCPLQYIHFD